MVEVMVIQDKEKLISKKCALENVWLFERNLNFILDYFFLFFFIH